MVARGKRLAVTLGLAATAASVLVPAAGAGAHQAPPHALISGAVAVESGATALDLGDYPPPPDRRHVAALIKVTADAVIPGPGLTDSLVPPGPDSEYGGVAALLVPNPEGNEVCFKLGSIASGAIEADVSRLGPVTAVQIHSGSPGETGPVVLTLQKSESGDDPAGLEGCAHRATQKARKHVTRHLKEISGLDLYIEVNTREFPNGALRGDVSGPFAGQAWQDALTGWLLPGGVLKHR